MIADMATKIEASRQLVSHANDLQSKGPALLQGSCYG